MLSRMVGDRPRSVSVRFNGPRRPSGRDVPGSELSFAFFASSRYSSLASCEDLFRNRLRRHSLGKPNFSFQKRQKELARKKKNEEKRQRKLDRDPAAPAEDQQSGSDAAVTDRDSPKD